MSLTRKYGCHTTRSRSSSVASATAELTWSESEPALPGPSSISNADDFLQLGQPPEPSGPNFFVIGVCLMDSTFFENFVCNTKTCKQLLDIKDIRSFTVDKLWGCVTLFCQSCATETRITTVKESKETQARFITAVDTTGVLVSKAAELFLCNDLLPPHFYKIVSKNKEHGNAALIVAEESVDRALVAEPIHNGGITLQPYW